MENDPEPDADNEAAIRVLIADDDPLRRAGYRAALISEAEMVLVGEARDGTEAQHLCQEHQPDVLLLDMHMPGLTTLEVMSFIFQHCPNTKTVICAAYNEIPQACRLVEAGVSGFLLKEEDISQMIHAIRAVEQGQPWFSRGIAEKLLELSKLPALTEREEQILRLIIQGRTDRQIGQELALAERTVRYCLDRICEKLGVNTRVEAAAKAIAQGCIDFPENNE